MANVKPIELRTGHWTKDEIEARKNAEDKLKGNNISDKVPSRLTSNGKKIYKHLLSSFPNGFLTDVDSYSLEIVANAIDMMQQASKDIKDRGMFINGDENPSIRIYERYSKIFNTYGSKLGMSPRDRASLSALLINQQQQEDDKLLKILGGGDN